jgi:hypothetical protein
MTTSANQMLGESGLRLPRCTSLEVLEVTIVDQNGDAFAHAGNLLP